MLPDINKILYATDLSKNSAHAFRYAVYFAKRVLRRSRKPVFIIPLPKGETETSFDDDD
jgi:hypothetical protein